MNINVGVVEGFTKRYNVDQLFYFELQKDFESTVKKEKQLKNWHRKWKINLIEAQNKECKDLYSEISDPIKIIYS